MNAKPSDTNTASTGSGNRIRGSKTVKTGPVTTGPGSRRRGGLTRAGFLPTVFCLALALAMTAAPALSAQESLSAQEILRRADQVVNAPRDQKTLTRMILRDSSGNERERMIEMLQKGSEKRISRFLSPADQRGIAVLSLPDGVTYLYLPAFKRVKRIASHVKNRRFAGTDFSYEDLEAKEYAEEYDATVVRGSSDSYVLELIPRDRYSEYSRLVMTVDRDNFVTTEVEYHDKRGSLYKRMTSSGIEKIDGYWVVREREMKDLERNHSTRMILEEVSFDTGLSDSVFTPRYLQR